MEYLGAVLSLFGVLIGAWFGWVAAHRVAERSTKRDWYTRYIASMNAYAMEMVRRVDWAKDHGAVENFPSMPSKEMANAANDALVGVIVLGPVETVELASKLQSDLSDMSRLAASVPPGGFPDTHEWHTLYARYEQRRIALIRAARHETGSKPLPANLELRGE